MKRKIAEGLATLFILFHLLAVLVYPNPYSVLARYVQPIINPYGNLFGLNTTWQFFSPDPGQLRHIEYDVIVEDGEEIDFDTHTWPPDDKNLLQVNRARRFYHAVRTIVAPARAELYLVPFLCRKHPQATSIAIKAIEKRAPSMERAELEGESFSKMNELSQSLQPQEYFCMREKGEG